MKRSVCTIATEVSSRAGNAIVVINFRMMGLRPPHDHGNGKLDHKVRRASRFVQMLWRRSAWRFPVAPGSLRGLQRQRYLPLQRARGPMVRSSLADAMFIENWARQRVGDTFFTRASCRSIGRIIQKS